MIAASSARGTSLARRARSALGAHAAELVLVAVFVALVAPVIASGGGGTAGARDERLFHLPTVRALGEELPRPDLVHVGTATSPGFHLALSVVARLVSDDRAVLEAVGSLFSLAMVLVAFALIARYTDRSLALVLTLPLVLSHYVLQSAAWLNTDNTAVLVVLLTVGAALTIEATGRGLIRGGAWVFFAVWVRQLALWAAGPFLFAAALAGRLVPGLQASGSSRWDYRPLARAALALVPALASLAALAAAWGQLTPPLFAEQSGLSPAAIPFTLALAGIFGAVFAACVVTRADLLRGRAPAAAAAAGAVLALAAPTSETVHLQRRTGGGLWKLVDAFPVVADRSTLIAVLAPLGGVVLVALWRATSRRAPSRPAAVLLVAMLSLACAQATTTRTYQRYFEPVLLVLLALMTTLALRELPAAARAAARRRTIRVMAALAVVQFAGCVWVVYTAAL